MAQTTNWSCWHMGELSGSPCLALKQTLVMWRSSLKHSPKPLQSKDGSEREQGERGLFSSVDQTENATAV